MKNVLKFLCACAVMTVVIILVGCGFMKFLTGAQEFRFSHKRHLEEDIECNTCHTKAEKEDHAGIPSKNKCMTCHEGLDEKKPPEKKIDRLFDGDKLKWSYVTKISDDAKFSHKSHLEAKVECASCHKGIKTNEAVSKDLRVSMAECNACHKEKQVKAGTECATCHKEIRRDAPPVDHRNAWKERHGKLYKAETDEKKAQCYFCHTETQCSTCHKEEKPKNHTETWKQFSHGSVAAIDRDRCATCHQSVGCDSCHLSTAPRNHTASWIRTHKPFADAGGERCYVCHQVAYCNACHTVTRPLNHVGGWGAPTDNHCLTCKEPVSSTTCFVCHKSVTSHLGKAQPSWHVAGVDCRACHRLLTPTPRHVDDGGSCLRCH